jgi:hypothetical protein
VCLGPCRREFQRLAEDLRKVEKERQELNNNKVRGAINFRLMAKRGPLS